MNIAQHWRLNEQRYSLVGEARPDGTVAFPPRPETLQRDIEQYDFDREPSAEEAKVVEVNLVERVAS